MNESDENNHLKLTQNYVNKFLIEDPDFLKIKEECQDEMVELFMEVVAQEKEWAKYLFKDGGMLGLNEKICCDYVDWIADKRMRAIGLTYPLPCPSKNPLPWTEHWIAGGNKQTALQEAENDQYLLGILTGGMEDVGDELALMFPNLSNKVVGHYTVYSKDGCMYCDLSKKQLHEKGLAHQLLTLDEDFTKEDFLSKVPEHHRTFPAIFADGVFLGGYTELKQHLDT